MIAGRYSLQREIGRGGMGAVWLGVDEVLERQVALKRIGLLPGADRTDLARAEREARLAARLDHPHVVAVLDVVDDPDTEAKWLVMEYVEGTTLAGLVQERGPLSSDEAAPLLRQAADALVAAHAAGIVHRDVKPSNILVDRHGQVKLADFGIARVAADPALTQTGLVTGSPAYLAPEVAAGQRGDAASDVWSMGATLFHVLSGRPPYDMGENVLSGLYRVVHDEPPRLSEAGWLAPLVEATMVKDPARRWSMAQVRDFLAGPAPDVVPRTAPLQAPLPATVPDGRSGRSSRGLLAALGVGLVAVLALATALLLHQPSRDAAARPASKSTSGGAAGRSPAASASASRSSTPSPEPKRARPTAAGMQTFIRSYVAAVASDPDRAWTMLTPKFQRESGGLQRYRDFWDGVGRSHLLAVSADPAGLVVRYRVRFDHFGTGRRPTVLQLVFDHGRYRIDGERTAGFVPAS